MIFSKLEDLRTKLTKDLTLPFAVYLDKDNSKLIGDKNSPTYKMVVEILEFVKEKTGVVLPVIGTKKDNSLFFIVI